MLRSYIYLFSRAVKELQTGCHVSMHAPTHIHTQHLSQDILFSNKYKL